MTTATAALQDLPLHVFRPTEHLLAHLVNHVRPDGRNLLQPRPIAVMPTPWQEQPHVVAAKQVQIGGSVAFGVVKLTVGRPSLQKPSSGDIDCKVSMNHLLPASLFNQRNADETCTSSGNASAFPGDLTPSIQEVEYMITTVFNMDSVVDLTQLVIDPETAAMRLTVHITVLSYAGNLRDLCFLTAMLALREAQLPTVVTRPSDVELKTLSRSNAALARFWLDQSTRYAMNYETRRPLTLQRCVVPVTLATLSDRRSALSVLELLAQSSSAAVPSDATAAATWLLDPTADEERVADGVATFIVDPARQTVVFSALNASSVTSATATQLRATAVTHATTLREALQL